MKALRPHHHCVIRHEANASVILQQVQFKPAVCDHEPINNKRTIYTQLVLQTTTNQYVHRTCMLRGQCIWTPSVQRLVRPRVTIYWTNQRTSSRTSSLWSLTDSKTKTNWFWWERASSSGPLSVTKHHASSHKVVAEKLLDLSSIGNNQISPWHVSPGRVTAEVFSNVKVVKWSAVHCV